MKRGGNTLTKVMQKLRFISTDIRRGWIICNIIFAAIPLAVAILANTADVYAAVLTYCYALLVVGEYLFYRYIKIHKGTEVIANLENSDTIFWSSLLFIGGLIFLIAEYNSNPKVSQFINDPTWVKVVLSIVTIVISFYLAYKLNWPMISKEEADERQVMQNYKDATVAKQDAQNMRPAIEEELREESDEGH